MEQIHSRPPFQCLKVRFCCILREFKNEDPIKKSTNFKLDTQNQILCESGSKLVVINYSQAFNSNKPLIGTNAHFLIMKSVITNVSLSLFNFTHLGALESKQLLCFNHHLCEIRFSISTIEKINIVSFSSMKINHELLVLQKRNLIRSKILTEVSKMVCVHTKV